MFTLYDTAGHTFLDEICKYFLQRAKKRGKWGVGKAETDVPPVCPVAAVYDRRKAAVGMSATAPGHAHVTVRNRYVTGPKAPFLIGNVTV
jgi:hypothetical protein